MSGEIIQMDELEEGQEEKPDTEVFLDIPVYQEIVAGLSERGHKAVLMDTFGSVVVGVQKEEERITATSDFRKSGAVAGF